MTCKKKDKREARYGVAQDQRSVVEQLQALIKLANQAGMYDAADWVRYKMEAGLNHE